MGKHSHYTSITHSPREIARWRKDFFTLAGPSLQLLCELMANAPGLALIIKDAHGRIMHMNDFNVKLSGWSCIDDTLGYTSEELYPPDQAAVYGGRDREVMETGVPIVERVYGYVADRSTDLNCVTVRPVVGLDGSRIGTATIYHRAQKKMKSFNWYDPIRKSVAHLNEHYAENVSVKQLASISHYSIAQFRKLFVKLMHMSPSAYVTQVRINAAKTLLKTTDKLIADIAVETGFCDHSHFIKTFRAATGQTPNEFRRSQGLILPARPRMRLSTMSSNRKQAFTGLHKAASGPEWPQYGS